MKGRSKLKKGENESVSHASEPISEVVEKPYLRRFCFALAVIPFLSMVLR